MNRKRLDSSTFEFTPQHDPSTIPMEAHEAIKASYTT
jgi:hypothetical protein